MKNVLCRRQKKNTNGAGLTDNSKITIFGDVTKKGNFVIYILNITLFALPFMVSLPCMVITTFTNYGKITNNGLFRTDKGMMLKISAFLTLEKAQCKFKVEGKQYINFIPAKHSSHYLSSIVMVLLDLLESFVTFGNVQFNVTVKIEDEKHIYMYMYIIANTHTIIY